AGKEPGARSLGRRDVEAHVLAARARWTRRPAIDAGRHDRADERAVSGAVALAYRLPAGVVAVKSSGLAGVHEGHRHPPDVDLTTPFRHPKAALLPTSRRAPFCRGGT